MLVHEKIKSVPTFLFSDRQHDTLPNKAQMTQMVVRKVDPGASKTVLLHSNLSIATEGKSVEFSNLPMATVSRYCVQAELIDAIHMLLLSPLYTQMH
jgi:hypothetical protein